MMDWLPRPMVLEMLSDEPLVIPGAIYVKFAVVQAAQHRLERRQGSREILADPEQAIKRKAF